MYLSHFSNKAFLASFSHCFSSNFYCSSTSYGFVFVKVLASPLALGRASYLVESA